MSNLTSENDAATVALGSQCKIPSDIEIEELIDNCNNIKTTLNGIVGRLFTSKINGQVLFLPSAGFFSTTNNASVGTQAHYWSKNYLNQSNSYSLYFDRNNIDGKASALRRYGFNIRPIKVINPNRSIVPPTTEDEPKEEETTTVEEPKDSNER